MKTYVTLRNAQRAAPNAKLFLRVLVDGSDDLFLPVTERTDVMVFRPGERLCSGSVAVGSILKSEY